MSQYSSLSFDKCVEFLATILPDELHVLVALHELDITPTDPVALVGVGLASTGGFGVIHATRHFISLVEAAVTILHLDVVGRARLLVDMRVGNARAEALQLDLLSESTRTTHDSCEEARIADFP